MKFELNFETICYLLFFLFLILPAGSAAKRSKRSRDYIKTPHLWYGTTEDGDCYIDIRKFIVYSPIEQCPFEWKQEEPFTAVAAVIRRDSSVSYVRFKARLCENESLYYLTDSEYKRICRYGRLLGQVMPLPNYWKIKNDASRISGKYDLPEESKFKMFGYNVSAKDDFSPEYRQTVLMFMIEAGLTSKYEAINHLDFNINNHAHNPNNRLAISKWEADRMFLSNYSYDSSNTNWVTTSNPPDVHVARTVKQETRPSKTSAAKPKPKTQTEAKGKNTSATTPKETTCRFKAGDRVNHKTFGSGVVRDIDLSSNHIFIEFEDGTKRFSLSNIESFLQ